MKLLPAVAAVAALSLAGCTSPCVQLAQKLCECQPTTSARDSCNTAATNRASQVTVTSADETVCSGLLDKCDCHAVDTAEGKVNCGLARP